MTETTGPITAIPGTEVTMTKIEMTILVTFLVTLTMALSMWAALA